VRLTFPETVLRLTRRGDLPAFKLPSGAIRYADVDAWLQTTLDQPGVSARAWTVPPRFPLASDKVATSRGFEPSTAPNTSGAVRELLERQAASDARHVRTASSVS
jgi:hypothetical protein